VTEHEGLPVHGYAKQSASAVQMVNQHKLLEEHILRRLDELSTQGLDNRWLAIARTHIELGFMALNRGVFQPQRINGDLDISMDWRD
jgi:hypothetical protein